MATYLYGRDSKGKVRVHILKAIKYDSYCEIHRWSGLLDGKLIKQPLLSILKGKVKRSIYEQTELEVRSIVSKQRDKGYKLLQEIDTEDHKVDPLDYNMIDALLPKEKTDANGARKPMLAKDVSDKPDAYYDKVDWMCSAKLDGVRLTIGRNADKKLYSVSRGGKSYDGACTKIFESKKLHQLFDKLGDDVMIDGEFYIHGRSLAYISGCARKEDYDPDRHDQLEFWIFDYGHETQTAEERCTYLNSIINDFDLAKDRIKIVKHVKLSSKITMKMMHDHWVSEGYEGLIARDCSRVYGYGSRDDRMIKLKEFKDDEFEILDISSGLRDEDMCFVCLTKDGKKFKAKPVGPRELKYQYLRDVETLKGKLLTVKYFYYTEDGIPYLPTSKTIRDYE